MSTEEIKLMFARYGTLIDFTKTQNQRICRIENMLKLNLARLSGYYRFCPEIHIRVVHGNRFRIFSDRPYRDKNIYVIVFYEATFVILDELINRICASNSILAEWGTTTEERKTAKMENPHITNFKLLWEQTNEEDPIRPLHKSRQTLVTILLQFAMSNLLFHEIGHIMNGHIDFKLNFFSTEGKNSLVDPSFLQTLEMDADTFAINSSLRELFFAHKNIERLPADTQFIFKSPSNLVGLWVFAQYFALRIFGENSPKIEDLKQNEHPPAGIRQLIIPTKIMSFIQDMMDLAKDEKNEFDEYFNQLINQAEFSFNEISSKELTQDSIKFALSKPGLMHMNFLFANWANVRPELEPFTYNENLPPVARATKD